jgi:hypothetical protein
MPTDIRRTFEELRANYRFDRNGGINEMRGTLWYDYWIRKFIWDNWYKKGGLLAP